MAEKVTAAVELTPEHPTLRALREVVQRCRGCELYRYATQVVFGEGPRSARIAWVGEQPASKLLNKAPEEAGIERSDVCVTNAVKQFRFEERGKRR